KDPKRALALTREHKRLYPNGKLSQEREVIAIEALSRLDQKNRAQQKATEFSEKYPESAHPKKVDTTLKESAPSAVDDQRTLFAGLELVSGRRLLLNDDVAGGFSQRNPIHFGFEPELFQCFVRLFVIEAQQFGDFDLIRSARGLHHHGFTPFEL